MAKTKKKLKRPSSIAAGDAQKNVDRMFKKSKGSFLDAVSSFSEWFSSPSGRQALGLAVWSSANLLNAGFYSNHILSLFSPGTLPGIGNPGSQFYIKPVVHPLLGDYFSHTIRTGTVHWEILPAIAAGILITAITSQAVMAEIDKNGRKSRLRRLVHHASAARINRDALHTDHAYSEADHYEAGSVAYDRATARWAYSSLIFEFLVGAFFCFGSLLGGGGAALFSFALFLYSMAGNGIGYATMRNAKDAKLSRRQQRLVVAAEEQGLANAERLIARPKKIKIPTAAAID